MSKKNIYLVEQVNLSFLINILFSNFFCTKNYEIHFFKRSNQIKNYEIFFKKVFGLHLFQIDQGLVDYNANEPSTFYELNSKSLALSKSILENIEEKNNFVYWISKDIEFFKAKKTIQQNISKEIMIYFVLQNYSKNFHSNSNNLYICLPSISSVFNINNIQSDNNIKIKKIIYLTRTILYRFISLVWSLLLNSSLNFSYKSSNNKKKIAIHHWKDLNHPLSDYWWLKDLKIKNEDVLFFFKNKKNPATDSNINLILENKFSFRILNKESNDTQLYSTRPVRIPLSIAFKIIIRFLKIFFFTNKTYLFKWQKYNWLSYVYDINYWYTFIKEENIIISKNDEYEISTDTLALASSIAKINKIGLHWSDRYFLEYNFMPISDVYFVWGKLIFDILRNEYDYKLSKLVEVGSTFHSYPHIENLYNISFKLRQQIKANKKNKFIVCAFDRSNDGTALYSNNYHIKFYDKLIEHIELNDDYFLIIKPKNKILESVLRQRSLNDRFKNLISNERLLMLDSKNDFFTVAKSADISISLGLNTAGVLSALSGVKSVFWDPSNFHKSQHAKNIDNSDFGNKNIIYENITDLLVDLRKHIESDNNNFKLRSSRDAFDDFGAYNRIAKSVSLFI